MERKKIAGLLPPGNLISRTDIVYISGPMSGIQDMNRGAFYAAEDAINQHFPCRAIINPAFLETYISGLTYKEMMVLAKASVRIATVLVMLPGWDDSPGASTEAELAAMLGKKILFADQIFHFKS